ncbi:MAG TPA: MFS transporter [Roseiflexaceae bacterium]|nr:MFS transporter [Roseiflexaceae bacterium]HMP39220.1 MFS transporter [Roseiflexaceae bacterium]
MFFSRVRTAAARIPPPVRRILLHSALFGFAGSIADLLFNFYLVSLGYGNDVVGLFSTIYRMAGVVLGLPIGLLIDRLGPRRALMAGITIYSLGWVALLLLAELPALASAQFLVGAAQLLTTTSVVPLLTSVTHSSKRASIFGLNASAALMIGLAGSAVAGVLPALAANMLQIDPQATNAYRVALMSVVVLALLAIVPIMRALPDRPLDDPAEAQWALSARVPALGLLRYALPSFLLGVGGGVILPFQNLFFRDLFGLDDAAVGLVLALTALGMGLGAALGGPVSNRIGLRRAAWVLRMCAGPAMLLMLVPFLPIAIAGFFLRGMFVAASYPLNDALVMQTTPPRQRGAAVSLMSILWSLGWAGAAALSGWSQVALGFTPALICSALTYALSALAIAYHRPEATG